MLSEILQEVIMDNQLLKTAEVFGVNLCLQRKHKGLTQLQLSKDLKMHVSTISNWENGLREPNLNTLIIISQYFDVSIDYMLNNKVNIPEHYIIVKEIFPSCLEYLYTASKNLSIQQCESLLNIIKLLIDLQKKEENNESNRYS